VTKDSISLEQLMQMSQDGDEKSYRLLLTKIEALLKQYLYHRMSHHEDMDDVIQEILISVHHSRHTYHPSRPFKPWLFAIAKFRLMDYLRKIYRKTGKQGQVSIDSYELEIEDESSVTNSEYDTELLHKALDQLPQKQRQIVILMKLEEHTAKEVAKKMNMKESAVKVSAHRAYKRLEVLIRDIEGSK